MPYKSRDDQIAYYVASRREGRCVYCGLKTNINPRTNKPYSLCKEDKEKQKQRDKRVGGHRKREAQNRNISS